MTIIWINTVTWHRAVRGTHNKECNVSTTSLLLPAPPADSLLLLLSCAGARAPARSPDERDPGGQELLVQQDSGLPEELQLLVLQLHIPDTVLSEGRSCLDDPSSRTPPSIYIDIDIDIYYLYLYIYINTFPCRDAHKSWGTQIEETSSREMQYSFSKWLRGAAQQLLWWQIAEKMRGGGGGEQPPVFMFTSEWTKKHFLSFSASQLMLQVRVGHEWGFNFL